MSTLLLTVELSDVTKQGGRRNLQYTGVIDPGDSFKFRVTDVRNPYSFRPTDSLIYRVFTSDNVLFEELDEGIWYSRLRNHWYQKLFESQMPQGVSSPV